MTQLWAWEYKGKTEYGWKHWERTSVSLYVAQDSSVSPIRDISQVTNLRKAKVVDEDAIVLDPHLLVKGLTDGEFYTYVLKTKPKPITEPKNFGAIVEAETANWANRRKFVKLMGVDDPIWFGEKEQSYFIWSDLINPIIISEGVEG